MKVVGKMGENYLVSMTEDEMLVMVFGVPHPTSDKNTSTKAIELRQALSKGEVEISPHETYKKMNGIYHTDLKDGYNSLLARIDAIKGLVTPIDEFFKSLHKEKQ